MKIRKTYIRVSHKEERQALNLATLESSSDVGDGFVVSARGSEGL
jgi:hypothetical protein